MDRPTSRSGLTLLVTRRRPRQGDTSRGRPAEPTIEVPDCGIASDRPPPLQDRARRRDIGDLLRDVLKLNHPRIRSGQQVVIHQRLTGEPIRDSRKDLDPPPSPTSTASTATASSTSPPTNQPPSRRSPPPRLTTGNPHRGELTAAIGRDPSRTHAGYMNTATGHRPCRRARRQECSAPAPTASAPCRSPDKQDQIVVACGRPERRRGRDSRAPAHARLGLPRAERCFPFSSRAGATVSLLVSNHKQAPHEGAPAEPLVHSDHWETIIGVVVETELGLLRRQHLSVCGDPHQTDSQPLALRPRSDCYEYRSANATGGPALM